MNKEFLRNLLAAKSPCGFEKNGTSEVEDFMGTFNCKKEFSDKSGNLSYSVGNGNIRIMISGHVDEIALQVQNVDDKGFIHFIKDGGIDQKVLLGATVTILTSHGEVKGVIGKMPIHVERGDAKDKAVQIKDMKIDVGAESKEDVLALGVEVGDLITIDDIPMDLGKNRFCGRGLDDKVGVFVAASVLEELSKRNLKNVKVFFVACTQEEIGGTGAVTAAHKIDPHFSFDYDVTFATDDDYVSPNEWGDIKLGKGGAIAYGPDSNRELSKLVKGVCEEGGIPYQEFSVKSGATNTVHIKKTSTDAATLLLSIPNRNMHTQVEVCDYRDLESLINMTVAAIAKIDAVNGKF